MTSSVHQTEQLLFSVLLQFVVMIGAARGMNTVFRRLGQPGVIGEIVAGLMLGPSLFGALFPDTARNLFGTSASPAVTLISQLGLILLMFQIGADFHFAHLRTPRNRRAVLAITAVSVTVPFAAGCALGWLSAPALAADIERSTYSLFLGVGMAITAVPILGRILRQYALTGHELGVVAISAAAGNDVVGWVLLAAIAAHAGSGLEAAAFAWRLGGIALFAVVLRWGLQPLVPRLLARFPLTGEGDLPPNLLALVLCLMFLAAMCTFALGIFAIFGGFAAGLLFHRDTAFVAAWRRQVGTFVTVFFLPVFFTFTGLRTNVLGLATMQDLGWLLAVLAVAVTAKMVPVYLASRRCGFAPTEAAILGSLMNTRALMELIVLNIGYDLGFIPPRVFTMMVIMAIATTLMAGPLLKWLLPRIGHRVPAGIDA